MPIPVPSSLSGQPPPTARPVSRRSPTPRTQPAHRTRNRTLVIRLAGMAAAATVLAVAVAPPAFAAGTPASLSSVIDSLRAWLVGLLAAVATLFLTIGGLRYITAGGDPAQVERAKTALKSAAIGYALAALSPLLVSILASVVGG